MSKDVLSEALVAIARYLAECDPDRVTAAQAAHRYQQGCELERFGAALKLLFARRTADSTVWKDEGCRSAAEWMASTGGTGTGEAFASLETARRLEGLPGTTEALRRGELSAPQVKEIAAAAAHRPQSEGELIRVAATRTMKGLKEQCRRVRAAASSSQEENERYLAIRSRRAFRHWIDVDGAFKGELTMTPDDGARLLNAVQTRADELFDEGRKSGHEEPPDAYRLDALVDLVTGGAQRGDGSRRPRVDLSIHVDAAALRRGHVADGELCEIRGVGPIPVATVENLLPEAFVKVVVTDSVDIASVCHIGRTIPATLRTAIEARDPTCVVPGCDVAVGLEIDHFDVPVHEGGVTRLDNLARLCHFHHAQKTYRGYELRGGPGAWAWVVPEPFDSPAPTGRNREHSLDSVHSEMPNPSSSERRLAGVSSGASSSETLFDSS